MRSFVVSDAADVSSGIIFVVVVVMNEQIVNGSCNEEQDIKSADSKTDNTGKCILVIFVSFYLVTSSK